MMTCHKLCLQELEEENGRLREALSLARLIIFDGEPVTMKAQGIINGALLGKLNG